MANADVYARWSWSGGQAVKKTDGKKWDFKNSGGWSWLADGSSTLGEGTAHAERQAWKTAWPAIIALSRKPDSTGKNATSVLQVKFVVDQQVCASCQRWMVVEVLSHLKQLRPIKAVAYAEVHTTGEHDWVRIGRETEWPKHVGMFGNWQDLAGLADDGVKA